MAKHTTRKDGYLKHTHNVNGFLNNLKHLHEAVDEYDREKQDYIFPYSKRIELSIQIAIADRLEKVVNTLMELEGDLIQSRRVKWAVEEKRIPQYPQDDEYNRDDHHEYNLDDMIEY
tara:strand:+ start:123 stop:473 length:351 start_codon:yes stop_codon:yes gene_type:complete